MQSVNSTEVHLFQRFSRWLWVLLLTKWLVDCESDRSPKNWRPPGDTFVSTILHHLTLPSLFPWQLPGKVYRGGPKIDLKLYLGISFMSHANDEKWDQREANLAAELDQDDRPLMAHPSMPGITALAPIGLFCSAVYGGNLTSSSYWHNTKSMEQELATVERIRGPAANTFTALSEGSSSLQNLLWDGIDPGGWTFVFTKKTNRKRSNWYIWTWKSISGP